MAHHRYALEHKQVERQPNSTSLYRWLSSKLQYIQGVSDGDTAVVQDCSILSALAIHVRATAFW